MGDNGTRTFSSESAQLHTSNFGVGGQNHCVGGSLAFPPTQARMNAHLATPAAPVYPNMWPLQTPMPSLMLDPAFFYNGVFTAGAQRAAMQQAGMSANVLSLGRVFPFGLDIAEGRRWGIPPALGEVQSLASINTAPSVSKNETERKRHERGKTKDLWSKLDALVSANEFPRSRRGRTLRSGRSIEELLAAVTQKIRHQIRGATQNKPADQDDWGPDTNDAGKKLFQTLGLTETAAIITVEVPSMRVRHASHAIASRSCWLGETGVEGQPILSIVHPEDRAALAGMINAARPAATPIPSEASGPDYVKPNEPSCTGGTDASMHKGAEVFARLLFRMGHDSDRASDWLLMYTPQVPIKLCSLPKQASSDPGCVVLMADLASVRTHMAAGIDASRVRVHSQIEAGSLNTEWHLAGDSPGISPLVARLGYQGWASVQTTAEGKAASKYVAGGGGGCTLHETRIASELDEVLKHSVMSSTEQIHLQMRHSDTRPLLSFACRTSASCANGKNGPSFIMQTQIPLGEHSESFGEALMEEAVSSERKKVQRVYIAVQMGGSPDGPLRVSLVWASELPAQREAEAGLAAHNVARADYHLDEASGGLSATFLLPGDGGDVVAAAFSGTSVKRGHALLEADVVGVADLPPPAEAGDSRVCAVSCSRIAATQHAAAGAWWKVHLFPGAA